jgi:hypothetical protein
MCCINESLACAFLERCLAEARPRHLAGLQRRHLADEVGHARVGWAMLASPLIAPVDRAAIAAAAPRLIEANVAAWRARIAELPPYGFPDHGLPAAAAIAATIDAAVDQIIRPGFAHVGI